MMKKNISTTLLLAAGTAFANAATLLVTFGDSSGSGVACDTVTANGQTWNKFHGQIANGSMLNTWDDLKLSDGSTNENISVWTQGCFGGNDSVASNGFTGATSTTTDLFPSGIYAGVLHGGGAANQTQFSVSGLVVGNEYTLQVLIGSGSDWRNGNSTCSILSGATISEAKVLEQNGNSGATFDGNNAITVNVTGGNNTGTNWAVLEYTFSATADTVEFQASSGGKAVADDIGAFRLTGGFAPEPSAFGLLAGLGALALVASRRRRSRK